jgi:hypothetical protein
VSDATPNAGPCLQERKDRILRQLDDILASRLFRHSKRCGPLLRHVVLETLEGRSDLLKERSIGTDVFGRKPSYDTTADPIVRTTASEVRKRIAQYYHEFGRTATVWIDLSSGSYVPEFRFPDPSESEQRLVVRLPEVPHGNRASPGTAALVADRSRERRFRAYGVVAALIVLAAASGLFIWKHQSYDSVESFWNPVWGESSSILAAGGGPFAPQSSSVNQPQTAQEALQTDRVGFVDAAAMAEVAALFRSRGKEFVIRRGGLLGLEELRRVPVVLIGSNNPWTTRLMQSLRFYIEYARPYSISLRDRQKPGEPIFAEDLTQTPARSQTNSYAIISRFVDRLTELPVIMLAGLGAEGTTAAAEFGTQRKYIDLLDRQAPKGWAQKNLQVVITSEVVNGNIGPPKIVAIHCW